MDQEKEVLFAPSQIFLIDKFEITYENGTFLYSIEMNPYNETKLNLNVHYNRMKRQWEEETNNSLLHLAQLLTCSNRHDQAKEIFEQMLNEEFDQQTKVLCYRGLSGIATSKNSGEEIAYHQKLVESKFGSQHASPMPDGILFPTESIQTLSTFRDQAQNYLSQTSFSQPLGELGDYLETDEANNVVQKAPQMAFMIAKTLMNNRQYQLAILALESAITVMRCTSDVEFDPLHKSECYQAMGDCYRELHLNEKALESYTSALNENIVLPPEWHIKILSGMGKVLVAMNQWEAALQQYIRAAEIYQTELPNANPAHVAVIEECIQQVTSHILSSNE
jgi:tetratricopeptide (TPR) repeat protein